MLKLHPILFPM